MLKCVKCRDKYVEEEEYLCIDCDNEEEDYVREREKEYSSRIYQEYLNNKG